MDIKDTLHSLFEQHVQRNPRHLAGIQDKETISYFELNKKANQLAHYLISKGLKNEQPVAFCLDRSLNVLITMLAILKAGGAYLPLDAAHPEERLLFILNDSNTNILITDSDTAHQFIDYSGTQILLDKESDNLNEQAQHNPNLPNTPNQLAYIIYTSGSTGIPKGVLIEHKSAVNYCQWLSAYCSISSKDRLDFSSNHIFDMAVTVTIATLALGATCVLCSDTTKINSKLYLNHIKKHKVTVLKMTPSYFKVLVQDLKINIHALPKLKAIIMGGEAINSADCSDWLHAYPNQIIYNEYGPTETTVGVTVFAVSKANVNKLGANVPIGQPGLNIECHIYDTNGKLVADGQTGELYIGGISLARGYLNRDELTKEYFVTKNQRLYKTGDLCLRSANGDLEYVGRIDDQIKVRGFRIEPAEVEKHLKKHPAIDAAVVTAQKDFLNQNQLVGYFIVKAQHKEPSTKKLRSFLAKHVPDYMIPSLFVTIDSIPLTANGKLDKLALPKPQVTINQNYQAPVTDVQKSLAQIWSNELGITTIGLEDDFFELGGHSLAAGRVISMINRFFSKNMSLYDLYQAPTVAKLATVIELSKNSKRSKLSPSKRWLGKVDDIPLSDFQFLLWMAHTFDTKVKKLNITLRRRFQGTLNKEALEYALKQLIHKQEVFNYHIFKFRPAQMLVKKQPLIVLEQNIQLLSPAESKELLEQSLSQLINYQQWTKNSPLLSVRLFHLANNQSELQICMPHSISDDFSPDILITELSHYYNSYQNSNSDKTNNCNRYFREYVFKEQFYFKTDLDRDIKFWDKYLEDASLANFPSALVIKNMAAKQCAYSTYIPIPLEYIRKLKKYCAEKHVSIIDGLIGVLGLALIRCNRDCNYEASYIFMNSVKSTRDNSIYDDAIGCFLRVEPVKIALQQNANLANLCEQIHQSAIDTSLHQRCPGIIKLASTCSVTKTNNPVLSLIIKSLASLYALLVKAPKVYSKIFNIGGVRLAQFHPQNSYLININVQHNFITEYDDNNKLLFGLKTVPIEDNKPDLLNIDNVFDVSFIRQDDSDQAYIVISANLNPDFREMVAKEVVSIMRAVEIPAEETV